MQYPKFVKAGIVLTAIAAAVLAGCSRSQASNAPAAAPAPAVSVAEVVAKPLRDFEEFTGRLESVTTVQIQPRVSGFIESAQFAEGAHVKKGQILFRIDPRPYQAEVDRLAAQLKRARSQASLAAQNHERGKQLIAKHVIAQQDFDQLETAATSSSDDIGSAQAAMESARLNLEFTEVRSPIEGRVSRMLITPGNLVATTSVLTTVVSDNPVYTYFDVDEATYLRFAHGVAGGESPVYMGLVDEQGYPHEGRLDFVDNQVDPKSGTIRARGVFDNKDGHFTPGLFARIKLVGGNARDTVLIDERAVGTDLGKKFVLALKKDNSLEYRPVTLGAAIEGLRVVREGLAAGDVIVVNGLQHVRPGATVNPTRVPMTTDSKAVAQLTPAAPKTVSTATGNGGRAALN
ncbi:MAG: efflux RND transporter periplasmic adaptor subunit [Rudaea sp.]|uniref:efflux RND transporter periplasmic adaptor subunit n=1 Tax=unclassified Rudaea TaxID=2627037 RepID=UPI0010F6C70C|nr:MULTISPECIES: efflux RND transporter periplasmic adaptor subunit [unclassified Rudaea]MBN8887120.1 efflux RND transporter periplasmic adaptor subunit [Rudaea sp.]MBR0347249.1 efflux RND transporter periplasmic adaptor subunit [Rudaea sp.]